jgi:anti-sigma factor RsiW
LRELYDPVLAEPIPEPLRRQARRQPRAWQQPLFAMAAGLMLLVTGTWMGMHLAQPDGLPGVGAPHLVREAAMAYAVYTPDQRHPVEVPGDQESHLVAWLSKRMGAPVKAPNLERLGYSLLGGRLVSSEDGPGGLMMYEDASKRRVVFYVCQNEEQGHKSAFRFARDEGVSVFYWFDGAFSYAVAGDLDRSGLLDLAESVYQQTSI